MSNNDNSKLDDFEKNFKKEMEETLESEKSEIEENMKTAQNENKGTQTNTETKIDKEFEKTGEKIIIENQQMKTKKVPWWKFDKERSKEELTHPGKYLKEQFSNRTNLLIYLGFLDIILDTFYRYYLGGASSINSYSLITDTIILIIVLFALIRVAKLGIWGIVVFLGGLNFILTPLSTYLTSTNIFPAVIVGVIVRTILLGLPVLIFAFVPLPFIKDEDVAQKKGLIITILIGYAFQTGFQGYIFNYLTDPSQLNVFKDPVGLAAFTLFYFFFLNAWMWLGCFGKFSEICKPESFAKLLKGIYILGFIILFAFALISNWGFWNSLGAISTSNDNVNVNQAIGTSASTLWQAASSDVYMWKLTILCGMNGQGFSSIFAFNWVGLKNTDGTDMTPDQACAMKANLTLQQQYDYRTSSNVDTSVKFAMVLTPDSTYDGNTITSLSNIITSGKVQVNNNIPEDKTDGSIECTINSNLAAIDNDQLIKQVSGAVGGQTIPYTCSLPSNILNDYNALYNIFGASTSVTVVSYFNYSVSLASFVDLKFTENQAPADAISTGTQTGSNSAVGSSPKESAILSFGTQANLPILITTDPTPVLMKIDLNNAGTGKITGMNDMYIILPSSISISDKNNYFKPVSLTALDPKALNYIRKISNLQNMNFNAYEIDKTGTEFQNINNYISQNNKLTRSYYVNVAPNLLFGDNIWDEDAYVWTIVNFKYQESKTQFMTLSNKISQDIQANQKPKTSTASSDATSVNTQPVDAGFTDVADKTLPPEIKATLDIIAWAEGTNGANGYNTLYGGGTFSSYSSHPDISKSGPSGSTTAAGRYQFEYSTWTTEIVPKTGLSDFSPTTQDIGAVELLKIQGAYNDALNGNILTVCSKINKRWVSLPGGSYQTRSASDVQNMYTIRLNYYKMQNGGTIT